MNNHYLSKSFTLIELLIVLAIIAIIAAILIVIIKPTEIFKETRDKQRISDLHKIENLINMMYVYNPAFNELDYASSQVIYLSLKDSSSTCGTYLSQGRIPQPPPGYSYHCSSDPQNMNGTGWIPIPFSENTFIALTKLPIDPINDPPYYYAFVIGGSYLLYAQLEKIGRNSPSFNDNDNFPHLYSVGTNKNLLDKAQGLVGYWPFDEGSGTTTKDYSGNGNNGNSSSINWSSDCKLGKCVKAESGYSHIIVTTSQITSLRQPVTIVHWIKINNPIPANNWPYSVGGNSHVSYSFRSRSNGTDWMFEYGTDYPACSGNYYTSNWSKDLGLNNWHFLVSTYDGQFIKIYFNGKLDRQTSFTNGFCNLGNLYLGLVSAAPGSFTIDEVRIYNRALSAEEIKALYEATR